MSDTDIQSDELDACKAYEEVMTLSLFTPAEQLEVNTTITEAEFPF